MEWSLDILCLWYIKNETFIYYKVQYNNRELLGVVNYDWKRSR